MDNTNKSNSSTDSSTPAIDPIFTAPSTPAPGTPLPAEPTTSSFAGLGMGATPAPETPKTDPVAAAIPNTTTSASVGSPAVPAAPAPIVADTTASEAHAGITPPAATPPMATAESNVTDPGYSKTKSNHMILIIVVLVVLAFVSVLAMFFYRQYSNVFNPSTSNISPTPAVAAIVSPTSLPSPTPANQEEAELQSLTFEDIDPELQTIDKDISQL